MKQYKSFKEVKKEFGFWNALEYKILELRIKNPFINNLLSFGIINKVDSTSYNPLYTASRDSNGKLTSFNPNPSYSF